MRLPGGKYPITKTRRELFPSLGLNTTNDYADGDFFSCERITTEEYPYIQTDDGMYKVSGYSAGVRGLAVYDGKRLTLEETSLYLEGELVVDGLTAYLPWDAIQPEDTSPVDITIMQNYAVFDRLPWVVDIQGKKKYPSRYSASSESASLPVAKLNQGGDKAFYIERMGRASLTNLASVLRAGRRVTLSYTVFRDIDAIDPDAGSGMSKKRETLSVEEQTLPYHGGIFFEERATLVFSTALDRPDETWFTDGEAQISKFWIRVEFPRMDYVCAHDNRIWCCDNETKTIYASSLGDPFNFYAYDGLSTDSYALEVKTDGDFTGCCATSDAVLFFKENAIYKVLGSTPADYTVLRYECNGVKSGCFRSIAVINDAVYYVGRDGLYRYDGGKYANHISHRLGQHTFENAVGTGTRTTYFVCDRGSVERTMYEFSLESGRITSRKMPADFSSMITHGNAVIAGACKSVSGDSDDAIIGMWCVRGGGIRSPDKEPWEIHFRPFRDQMQRKQRPQQILLRVSLQRDAWVRAWIREEGKRWKPAGMRASPQEDTGFYHEDRNERIVTMRIPPGRSNKFELKLDGEGECRILNLSIESVVGGER